MSSPATSGSAVAALDSVIRRRRRWLLILAAAGISGYGAYRLYNHPSVARKRRRVADFVAALVAVADAVSSSAETVALVSEDLNRFLRSDSDEIPASLRQLGKIVRSNEVAGSISRVSDALVIGIARGLSPKGELEGKATTFDGLGLSERVLDKLFSREGSGFVSVIAGSFARNLVIGYYSKEAAGVELHNQGIGDGIPQWVYLICDDRFKNLIGYCIQQFVSSAVTVFLEKTKGINTYDELFSGLTNPKHEAKVKSLLITVCNGAVETLVRTSHQVMMNSSGSEKVSDGEGEGVSQVKSARRQARLISSDEQKVADVAGWVSHVSSTLAVPSNRTFVLDVTGRVTFETVRSLLEFFLLKMQAAGRRSVSLVHQEVVERGLEVVRYVSAKSMTIFTICLALCVQLSVGARLLVPV